MRLLAGGKEERRAVARPLTPVSRPADAFLPLSLRFRGAMAAGGPPPERGPARRARVLRASARAPATGARCSPVSAPGPASRSRGGGWRVLGWPATGRDDRPVPVELSASESSLSGPRQACGAKAANTTPGRPNLRPGTSTPGRAGPRAARHASFGTGSTRRSERSAWTRQCVHRGRSQERRDVLDQGGP